MSGRTNQIAPGITLLPSGRFRWKKTVGGVTSTGTCDSLTQARQARQQTSIEKGASVDVELMTVQELIDTWLVEIDERSAQATKDARTYALSKVPAVFMERQVDRVTPPIAAALWREMKRTMSAHIVAEARKALSGAWQLGIEWGIATSNPIRAAKFAKPVADEVVPPTPATVVALIDYFASSRPPRPSESKHAPKGDRPARPAFAAWCQLMATVGTRPGEACAARWDRLDPDSRILRIGHSSAKGGVTEGKNGRAGWRDVELDLDTFSMLKVIPRVVGVPWIFHRGREPWTVAYARRGIVRAREALNLGNITPYDLRHFAATQALAAHKPLTEVARMLGDNPATVASTYAHWIDEPVSGANASNAAVLERARRQLG